MTDRPAPGHAPARGSNKFPDLRVRKQEPGTAFVAWAGAGLADILSIQEERSVSNDNCVRYKRLTL